MKIKIDDYWKPQLCTVLFFFLYLIKPRFYYISAGLMRSASHGDVSMVAGEFNLSVHHSINSKRVEVRILSVNTMQSINHFSPQHDELCLTDVNIYTWKKVKHHVSFYKGIHFSTYSVC